MPMAYKALYNKYRPQTFEEVAGQRSIVKTLANAIKTDKIAHAYLFCGPRGTGKTSMARLFAKALNCETGLGNQCNSCQNCLSINDGSHPDVVEIDAASNNGVDQVRDLIEKVKYSPLKGRYKIYIIDEVHMMTSGAFNALLKTLEEPPAHVIFILATTEPYKVLPTIISRCQRFDFEKISDEDVKNKLIWILEKESVQYDSKSLDLIAELCDGGMRDALSILEQVLAYSGNSITENDILTLFGLTSNIEKIQLLKVLRKGDVATALAKLEGFVSSGVDIKRLSSSLLDILKDLVIYEKTHKDSLLTSIDEKEAQLLEPVIDFVYANKMIDILLKAQGEYKSVSNIRSLFELTILQLAALAISDGTPILETKPEPIKVVETPKPVETPAIYQPIKETPVVQETVVQQPVNPIHAPEIEKPFVAPTPVEQVQPKVENIEHTQPIFENNPAIDDNISFEPNGVLGSSNQNSVPTQTVTPQPEVKPIETVPVVPQPEPVAQPSIAVTPVAAPVTQQPEPSKPSLAEDIANKIVSSRVVKEGDMYQLDRETIIQIMVLGNKEERHSLTRAWPEFEKLKVHPALGSLATLLSDGKPYCLSKDCLLVSYNFKNLSDKANIKANQAALSDMIASVLGRKVFVYALNRIDVHDLTDYFTQLQQVGKLPKKDEIVLHLPIEEI